MRAENPASQARVQFGEYPHHFIAGKSKLYIGLISGDKLRDIQSFGTQDPFCEVFLSRSRTPSSSDLIYRSKTHDNGGRLALVSASRLGFRAHSIDWSQARTLDGWRR